MSYNLNNPIAKRATKVVYEDDGNTIKLFNEGYSKADIFNEAMNHARVEEGTNLNMAKIKEVVDIDNKLGIAPSSDGVSIINFILLCVGIIFCELV